MRVMKNARTGGRPGDGSAGRQADGSQPPGPSTQLAPDRWQSRNHQASPDAVIDIAGVWKVYGPAERKAGSEIARGAGWSRTPAALRDVSLQIHPGEIFVVVGLSGSGKTTLLRSINGLVQPTAGTVRVLGTDVAAGGASLRELRSRVGMIFQLFGILPHRSVVSNAAFGLELRGVSRTERERRASETLSLVGLEGREHAYPDELSGGQLQRVGLARALALDPDVLLMDEPFSALDVLIREELRRQLLEIQTRLRKTIVLITHDLTDAVVLADRIALLHEGCLRQVGTVAEVCFQPKDEVVERYITHVPQLEVLRVEHALVGEVASDAAPAVHAGAPLAEAITLLSAPGVSALRVLAENGETAGSVTADAVVRALGRGPTVSQTEVGP